MAGRMSLLQSLLPYVMSHLSSSIVENIIKVLIVNGRLKWRDYAPCVEKHIRSDPMLVLEAAGRAIQARFMLQNKALQKCAVKSAFLNFIKKHWAHCEFFREGRKGRFPEHGFLRHELFLEAMRTYAENPSSDTFHSATSALSWSLASKSCPLSYTHPALHSVEYRPAFEHSGNIKALRSSEADVGKGMENAADDCLMCKYQPSGVGSGGKGTSQVTPRDVSSCETS